MTLSQPLFVDTGFGEALDLAADNGYVVSIDAAPTTYDTRSQGWVFAICIHTLSLGCSHHRPSSRETEQKQGLVLWHAHFGPTHHAGHQACHPFRCCISIPSWT